MWEGARAPPSPIVIPPALADGAPLDGLDEDVVAAFRRCVTLHSRPRYLMAPGLPEHGHTRSHLRFDESVLQAMAARGWMRSHGYTELIPIACALAELMPRP